MERRQFIRLAGTGAAAGLIGNNLNRTIMQNSGESLSYHRIDNIKFTDIRLKYPRLVGKNSQLDIHGWGPTAGINILYTDKGATAWGLNRGSQQVLKERFELIKGKTVADLINPKTGVISPELHVFDFSLFDLAGKILNKPVYQLLGKNKPQLCPCYSGMIYFDDLEPKENPAGLEKILDECKFDYGYGYRQFKLKIGRGNKWMDKEKGLQRDIEVTKLVRKNFPDCDILVDGNNGFTCDEFIKYLEGIGDIRLFWIEEPFDETTEDYKKLRTWLSEHKLKPLLADGEAHPDENLMKQLGDQKLLDVFLEDISSYGFTNWIKLIGEIKPKGILASPHAWGLAIKTNYVSHLCGAFGNMPTIEGVTSTSEDIDLTDYKLVKGRLIPSSKPGFGMDLLKKV
jgi:D-galactarolactone cycloisomerase